jgi:hypothetical protein
MTRLDANFASDLLVIARQHLKEEWGSEAERIADDRILDSFFDSLRRRPAARPRRIWVADDFHCPQALDPGWKVLQEKVVNGDDLGPHLSFRHSCLTNLDGLLNEWGVHHLHLGTGPSFKDRSYIGRTAPLLFALITEDDFYAINVYPHGAWESTGILESLHRNWPQVINRYRIKGIQGEPLREEQRKRLRSANVQTATAVSDGTVYMAIGGGVAGSGTSVEAVFRAARMLADVRRLQLTLQEQLPKFVSHLRSRGYRDAQDIKAKLVGITPQGYQVLFPDYSVLASVKLGN